MKISLSKYLLFLRQKTLIFQKLYKSDMVNLADIFYTERGYGNINHFCNEDWDKEQLTV